MRLPATEAQLRRDPFRRETCKMPWQGPGNGVPIGSLISLADGNPQYNLGLEIQGYTLNEARIAARDMIDLVGLSGFEESFR